MESIIFTTDASLVLAELLGGVRHEDLFIVADKHTVGFCDRLFEKVDWIPSHVAVLDCGEEYKSLESVSRIWAMLSKRGAHRSSILVCVGDGFGRVCGFHVQAGNTLRKCSHDAAGAGRCFFGG